MYDWAILDDFVAKAQQYGKELIIGYRHGCISGCGASRRGASLVQRGPTQLRLRQRRGGPATWTPEFQGPWRELIRATILRYRDEPEVVGFIFSGVGSWEVRRDGPERRV